MATRFLKSWHFLYCHTKHVRINTFSQKRHISTTKSFNKDEDIRSQSKQAKKVKDSKGKAPRVKEYAVKKFIGFMGRYLEMFEKRLKKFPKAFHIYKIFKDGVKFIYRDSKSYYRVQSGVWYKQQSYKSFTHEELSNFRQIPSDMLRVGPVLLISALPAVNYVIFPIAYMFPRHLLCRHFWTEEQKMEFGIYYLKSRINHYPKIGDLLERESVKIQDVALRKIFQDILHKIEKKEVPSVDEIIATKPLFETRPYGLDRLYRRHRVHMQWHIARSWNFPGRKSKLLEHTHLLHATDMALLRENHLNMTELQQACFYRGLNPEGLNAKEIMAFLNTWVQISKHVSEDSFSLLLHCNYLLTSTHRNNQKYLLKNVDITEGIIKPS